MRKLAQVFSDLPDAAHKQFVRNTPVRSGNARRNTDLVNGTNIVADYPYSQRLEDGWSKQAPRGMVEPTEEWIQKEVDRRLKGL